ncbi:glycosyltransferase family 2 protein [Pleurocapsales cyanobacterium LEGE 06147]|nr:glycosyltransferase family 2 protein [Pleurocapsales cyanobacterium LEGE 06147]
MIPQISVIIPAYNTANYIGQAIESVLGQTYHNIEVIVVDDASTDATAEVAQKFVDERLKVIINQKNSGVSYSRNRALREAKGTWIALLDSDDWFAPKRLEKLLQVAQAEGADLIADDLYLIRDDEKSPWSTLLRESEVNINTNTLIDPVSFIKTDLPSEKGVSFGQTKPLIKRQFLLDKGIKYDENLRAGEDFTLYLKCLIEQARFVVVPKPYYFYRNRQNSLGQRTPITYLNQSREITLNFLQDKTVRQNSDVVKALSQNLEAFSKNIAYYQVVEPLKQKNLWLTVIKMIDYPYFFIHLLRKFPIILYRRIQYYFLRNKNVMYKNPFFQK